jgi:tryptophanyl-tRNA synthetase
MMRAIYGPRTFGLYISALYQAGDIMLPQLPSFGGPKPVVVPVGVDQDPHIRLSRDLARKYSSDFGFLRPSATYHKLARSLQGDTKMSKRDPMSILTLQDRPDMVKKKIENALTGGRETVELHRRLGGIPEICSVYDTYLYHFAYDDDVVQTVYMECRQGERLCGECKAQAIEIANDSLQEHQSKSEEKVEEAGQILEETRENMTPDL